MNRLIVIGKNSDLYKKFPDKFGGLPHLAISHKEVASFAFFKTDKILILSFSKHDIENIKFIDSIRQIKCERIYYLSTSSVNVCELTDCYSYPRVKLKMESMVRSLSNCIILRAGTLVASGREYECRGTMTSNIDDLIDCIANNVDNLTVTFIPFNDSWIEKTLYLWYGKLIIRLKNPCILRPIDFLFKYFFGFRWYGYGILSAKLYGN